MERSQRATAATKRGADFSVRFADPTRKRNEKVWRPEATALERFSPIVIRVAATANQEIRLVPPSVGEPLPEGGDGIKRTCVKITPNA